MRKDEQKRKRSRSASQGIETKEDLNYEDEESELSSGDLSSSDLDLSHDYSSYIPKKKNKRKVREDSHSDALPPLSIPKGYISDKDEAGEDKVDENGRLSGGREYKVPVFTVPTRGETLFMFSKDPAALLGFRDSFVFLKRNTNLIKAHLSNEERGFLVDSRQLRSSFRTRDISVVTARSVFKKFGYRIIRKGRKGKDDYYFTEEPEEQVVEKLPQVPNGSGIKSEPIDDFTSSTNIGETHSSINNSIHIAATSSNSGLALPLSNMGKNGLQFEASDQYVNGKNYLHCAAITARQFNSSLYLYRRSNSTNYDLLTNIYQIPKTKQVLNESKSIIKKELERNTQKNPFIHY